MLIIQLQKTKPEFFGYSGVHLYAVDSVIQNEDRVIEIHEDSDALDLYKLANDIAIFLSNQAYPSTKEKNVKTFPVFGNPDHSTFIENKSNSSEGYHVIGYLSNNDVQQVERFLVSNSLNEKVFVQKYFDKLDKDVKEELEMLLEDRIVNELHTYLERMVRFFKKNKKKEVVIIHNP